MKGLDDQGLTIVELIVTCVIVSILSIVLVSFLGSWTQQNAVSKTRVNLLSDAQSALDQISDKVRLSASADQNNRWQDTYAPNAPVNLLSWSSGAHTLVLATAEVNKSGDIVFSDPLNYTSQKNNVIYFISGTSLYERTLAATDANNASKTTCPSAHSTTSCPADRHLADNVSNFTIKYYDDTNTEVAPTDARSLGISLTLAKTSYKQSITQQYSTRMVFRNE